MSASNPADAVREALPEMLATAMETEASLLVSIVGRSVSASDVTLLRQGAAVIREQSAHIAALTARVAEQTVQRDGWHRRVHELEAQLLEWLHANGPGGWIDDLRQRAKDADVAETKLTAINGLARIANAAIKERP